MEKVVENAFSGIKNQVNIGQELIEQQTIDNGQWTMDNNERWSNER